MKKYILFTLLFIIAGFAQQMIGMDSNHEQNVVVRLFNATSPEDPNFVWRKEHSSRVSINNDTTLKDVVTEITDHIAYNLGSTHDNALRTELETMIRNYRDDKLVIVSNTRHGATTNLHVKAKEFINPHNRFLTVRIIDEEHCWHDVNKRLQN